jgi:hypothetical protein
MFHIFERNGSHKRLFSSIVTFLYNYRISSIVSFFDFANAIIASITFDLCDDDMLVYDRRSLEDHQKGEQNFFPRNGGVMHDDLVINDIVLGIWFIDPNLIVELSPIPW